MKGRGRQSEASLAVVAAFGRGAPEPEPGLTDSEAAFWRRVVATKPPDWWDAGSVQLLAEYCRLHTSLEVVAVEVSAFDPEWLKDDAGLRRYDLLVRTRDKCQGRMITLSTKMRLSQQSRYDETKAHTKAKSVAAAAKPWQGS